MPAVVAEDVGHGAAPLVGDERLVAGRVEQLVELGRIAGLDDAHPALAKDITTAGRHPKSDLFLDDVTVSRRHAEIVRADDGFRLRDVGSLNGTYLNRERVEEGELRNGDEIQIGKYKLAYYSGR